MSPASELLLQQICDSVFPIGAYSHSFGLETFIQLGHVHDAASAAAYVADQINYPLTYTELLGMRLGYEAAQRADMDALVALELELQALKTPAEPRTAMNKLAARFIRTIGELEVLDNKAAGFFSRYATLQRDHAVNVAYGVFAALVWALYHFHGMDDRFRSERCAECSPRAVGGAPVSKAGDVGSGVRREAAEPALRLAASAGLSERETDVFMLLAQGRSRRFICDELFIADGTASSHIGHIYEKLGVHSKQELITLVRMECDNESQACGLNQRV